MVHATNEKPRWFFYPGWIVLHALAIVLAWSITLTFISLITNIIGDTIQVGGQSQITGDFLFLYVLLPIIGILTGILQYTFLHPYLPRMEGWIAATFLGWLLPFVIGSFTMPLLDRDNGTGSIMLGFFLFGVSIGLPQWWMLRERVHHAFWWLLAYGFGWWISGLLNLLTSESFIVVLIISLMSAIATSIACWLLLDWSPKHELEKRASGY